MADQLTTIADVREALDGQRTAMVTTLDERGTLSSRPVTLQRIDERGDPWFLVATTAAWVRPADGGAVNAAIVVDGDAWASFAGRAELVADEATIEDLSDPFSKAYFGDDAEIVALRVVTDRIEWWTAPGSLAQMFEIAKAAVTGQTAEPGESGTIEV